MTKIKRNKSEFAENRRAVVRVGKKLLTFITILFLFSGCYTTQKVKQIKIEEIVDTLKINKNHQEEDISYMTNVNVSTKFMELYSKSGTYPIEFDINSEHFLFNSCDTCKYVIGLKTYYGEKLVETDLQYEQFSFWETFLLNLAIGTVGFVTYSKMK